MTGGYEDGPPPARRGDRVSYAAPPRGAEPYDPPRHDTGHGPLPYGAPLEGQARPPARVIDAAATVTMLLIAWLLLFGGVFVGVFVLVFADFCPASSCGTEGDAFPAVVGGLAGAGVSAVLGMVAAAVRIPRRKLAWPFALVALVLTLVALGVGGFAYAAAAAG